MNYISKRKDKKYGTDYELCETGIIDVNGGIVKSGH